MSHRLWTIKISGSQPISFRVAGNPQIEHKGGTSVFHQLLTDEQAADMKTVFLLHGISQVEMRPMEGQTPEQKSERLSSLKQDKIWPCVSCPSCPWADHLNETSPCGLEIWPEESVFTLRGTSKTHVEAESNCPVPRHHPSLYLFS